MSEARPHTVYRNFTTDAIRRGLTGVRGRPHPVYPYISDANVYHYYTAEVLLLFSGGNDQLALRVDPDIPTERKPRPPPR
jgi:hypothetical protein